MSVKKIAIIGPESTGKSILAEKLALHYGTVAVPEYAREYLQALSGKYEYADLGKIAAGQCKLEDLATAAMHAAKEQRPLILDTDLLVVKVWSEIVFEKCDNRLLTQIANRRYDHYLLCYPDIAWQPDPLREYPDASVRLRHFEHYLSMLVFQATPFTIIKGEGDARFQKAADAVRYLFD